MEVVLQHVLLPIRKELKVQQCFVIRLVHQDNIFMKMGLACPPVIFPDLLKILQFYYVKTPVNQMNII